MNLSYSSLFSSANSDFITLNRDKFRVLISCLILKVGFDSEYYLRENPDVLEALQNGLIKSAEEHYSNFGYFEDRIPRPIVVDVDWYLAVYPDVMQSIEQGVWGSAMAHFYQRGFREGRLPSEGWSLLVL